MNFEEELLKKVTEIKTGKKIPDEKNSKDNIEINFEDELQKNTNENRKPEISKPETSEKNEKRKPPYHPDGKKKTQKEILIDDYLFVKLEYEKTKKKPDAEFILDYENNYEKLAKEVKKQKVPEIREKLAKLAADLQNKKNQDPKQISSGAEALWQMNVVLVSGLENITGALDETVKSRYNTEKTIYLKGLTKDVMGLEQQIKPCLEEIYEEYAEDIEKYLTPVSKLAIIYTQLIMSRLAINNIKEN